MVFEEWRDILDYEGLYQVSNTGAVRSMNYQKSKNIKELKLRAYPSGYTYVDLIKSGNRFLVHRLVANAFIANPGSKPQVNHKNGVKNDNRVDNLEWVTRSENVQHSFDKLNRKRAKAALGKFWGSHPRAKQVIQLDKINGSTINVFSCAREANYATGVSYKQISGACKRDNGSSGGFRWEFIKNMV